MEQKSNNNRKVASNKKAVKKTSGSSTKTGSGKKKPSKKRSRFKRKLRWGFLLFSLFFSLTMLAACLVFYIKYGEEFTNYQKLAKQMVGQSDLDTFRQQETSLVYDKDGGLISALKGEKDVYYLEYKEIPKAAVDAMISIEDKKFMNHGGIDLVANIRAAIALIKHKGGITQGASTITQQLARNIYLSNEVSYERKFKEIFISVELEKKYSKYQILEFYLNNIYFANGFYGIQAASKGYFSKDVSELSLSQIAFLCAVPNNPTIYNPFEHPENTKGRRDRILLQMYEDGKIGKNEYQAAISEEIKVVKKKVTTNNYVETYVFYSAARALMAQEGFEFRNEFESDKDRKAYEEAYTEAYNECHKSLYYAGYRIYTSIDLKKQSKLQQAVDDALKDYTDKTKEGIYTLQGAAVSIDNETGRVEAIVGGRYQKTSGYTLNRAYQSYRQPGSAIKPLIVYTPAFEKGYYPDTYVMDEKFEGGPSNSNKVYSGKITVRKAVEVSKNTIAWKIFEELTPKVGLSYLLNMNFKRIDKNDYYPAASLGGFTYGASPVEMTAAYAALENDGLYRDPTCIITIKDTEGNIIVSDSIAKKRIYDTNAARIMTDVLQSVMNNGTGRGLGVANMPSAGKSGTTNDKKDGWFVGYTPYYTTGVWVGYDIPKAMAQLSGATFPGSVWKQYMNEIHKDMDRMEFESYVDTRPPEVTKAPEEEIPEVPTEAPTEIPEVTEPPEQVTDTPEDPTDMPEDPEDWEEWPEDPDTEEPTETPVEDPEQDNSDPENEAGEGSDSDNSQNPGYTPPPSP